MAISTNGTAHITGASCGIGAIYADRFAYRRFDLIRVAHNHDRLHRLAKRLFDETGRAIRVVTADISDATDQAGVETLLRDDAYITTLINNAGVGATAPLLMSDVNRMDKMIALNVQALTRLTYAAAPGFVARGGSSIINTASIVGLALAFLNGVYGATKALAPAFSQSLNHELKDKNIRVQAVHPGATATDFWELAGSRLRTSPVRW